MSGYPLLRVHRPEATFAWRDGSPISAARFLHDVAALADQLPAHRHVVNLCADRYDFTVGFAAALCRQQINLLPPHDAPELLKHPQRVDSDQSHYQQEPAKPNQQRKARTASRLRCRCAGPG